MPEPTDDQWRDLYMTFDDYCRAAPWQWLSNADILGIEHLSGEFMGYCVVMGQAGFEYGLAVYVGDVGLAGYLALMTDEVAPESDEVLEQTNALSVMLADREFLDTADLATIRRLGLKYRGKGRWPLFYSTRPGYTPWRLEADEAVFLTIALKNVMDVASRIASGELDLYSGRDPGTMLTRLYRNGAWRDHWETFRLPPAPPPVADYPDVERLRRLTESKPKAPWTWELGVFYVHTPVQEGKGQRPYYPTMTLLVDGDSTLILGLNVLEEVPSTKERQDALVELLEAEDMLPEALAVDSARTAQLVESVAESLGVELSVGATPALDEAKLSLMMFAEE